VQRSRFDTLAQLGELLPFAATTAVTLQLFAHIDIARLPHVPAFAAGAAVAFAMAPCALGAVAIAAAMHAPFASAGFLCVSGIADIRAFGRRNASLPTAMHDGLAYALAAIACAFVAWRHGAALVHPRFAIPLWFCATTFALCALRYRHSHCAPSRWAPAFMLCGMLLVAQPPQYRATETTLANAFAGEPIDFTGVVARSGGVTTVVRYAITCCRADAAPVALRLERDPGVSGWVRASGKLELAQGQLVLNAQRVTEIAAPSDVFIYR